MARAHKTIELSTGDMTLALIGRKTAHYVRARDLPRGRIVYAHARLGKHQLQIPLVIESRDSIKVDKLARRSPDPAIRDPSVDAATLKACGRALAPISRSAANGNEETQPEAKKAKKPRRTAEQQRIYEDMHALTLRAICHIPEDARYRLPAQLRAREIGKQTAPDCLIRFRLPNRKDRISRAEARKMALAMEQAATILERELLCTRAYVKEDLELAHRYGLGVKASMQQAVLFLESIRQTNISAIDRAMRNAIGELRSIGGMAEPARIIGDEYVDGVGEMRLLANTPSAEISLGTAGLLMMGLTKRILLPTPLPISKFQPDSDYVPPVSVRVCARGERRHEAAVDVPITINPDGVRTYVMNSMSKDVISVPAGTILITEDVAREHGYASVRRIKQQFGKDITTLYSYPAQPYQYARRPGETLDPLDARDWEHRELPLDPDRAGAQLNNITDALHEAFTNGKSGRRSRRRGEAQSTSSEPSIRRGLEYMGLLRTDERVEALDRIAPSWAATDNKAHQASNGIRPLPGDVRTRRILINAEDPPADGKKKRSNPKTTHESDASDFSKKKQWTKSVNRRVPTAAELERAETELRAMELASRLPAPMEPEMPGPLAMPYFSDMNKVGTSDRFRPDTHANRTGTQQPVAFSSAVIRERLRRPLALLQPPSTEDPTERRRWEEARAEFLSKKSTSEPQR